MSFCVRLVALAIPLVVSYLLMFNFNPVVMLLSTMSEVKMAEPVDGRSIELAAVLEMLRAAPRTSIPDAQSFRALMDQMSPFVYESQAIGSASTLPRTPRNVAEKILMNGVPGVSVSWPGGERLDTHVVVYFHGGGYVVGKPEDNIAFASRISRRTGARVILPKYGLMPENQASQPLQDAYTVYKWLLLKGYDPSRISLSGMSAGGGLISALIQKIISEGGETPSSAVLMSPWVDMTLKISELSYEENDALDFVTNLDQMREYVSWISGKGLALNDPILSPIYGSFEGFPPSFITLSNTEGFRDEILLLIQQMRGSNVNIDVIHHPDNLHGWVAMSLPESVEDTALICDWILEKWTQGTQ